MHLAVTIFASIMVVAFCLFSPPAALRPFELLFPPNENDDDDAEIAALRKTLLAYLSIPLVSLGFTYFHIWLALWMMFYPLKVSHG